MKSKVWFKTSHFDLLETQLSLFLLNKSIKALEYIGEPPMFVSLQRKQAQNTITVCTCVLFSLFKKNEKFTSLLYFVWHRHLLLQKTFVFISRLIRIFLPSIDLLTLITFALSFSLNKIETSLLNVESL